MSEAPAQKQAALDLDETPLQLHLGQDDWAEELAVISRRRNILELKIREFIRFSVRVAADVECDGVVKQAVEDCGGDDSIAKDLAPSAEALIAGEDHGATFIASADELEEQVCTLAVDGEVADFVD